MYNKILLLVPSYASKGGIVNYFKAIEGRFTLNVEYFTRGAHSWPHKQGKLQELRRSINEIIMYWRLIRKGDISIIQTNTSLGHLSIIRDGIFLFLAHLHKVRTVVFFRGWDESFEEKLKGFRLKLFKKVFFRANLIIVLSNSFKSKIQDWGYKGDIIIETTVVDEELISEFNYTDLIQKIETQDSKRFNFLFLARTEIKKGLYEAIDAFGILYNQYPNTTLTIAGDGFELKNAKKYVEDLGLTNIKFKGFVTGKEKVITYQEADVFIFPSYTEGMPNSVLEAMAFGMPVVTTPVGGLVDFFIDGEHGVFIRKNTGPEIADICEKLMSDKNKCTKIAKTNFYFSRSRFSASQVVQRLEKIYESLFEQ